MAYYPIIKGYAPIYIQTATDSSAVDIMRTYGIVVKDHAIPYQMTPKEPYKNTWHDEHGDDEYIGPVMYMSAFTFSMKCVMITKEVDSEASRRQLEQQISSFQRYISSGEFKIYDDYTKRGFQHVRVNSFPMPSSDDYDVFNGKTRLIFDVEFKVNDPVTRMTMSSGKIVTV